MVRRSRICSVNSRFRSCIPTDAGSFSSPGGSNDMNSNFVKRAARCALWCVTIAALIAVAIPAFAQETTGTIKGRIVDAQGLAVPGATVTVTGPQGAKTTVTDAEGRFNFPFLTPGVYAVRAELQGFKAVEQK